MRSSMGGIRGTDIPILVSLPNENHDLKVSTSSNTMGNRSVGGTVERVYITKGNRGIEGIIKGYMIYPFIKDIHTCTVPIQGYVISYLYHRTQWEPRSSIRTIAPRGSFESVYQ